MKKLILVLCVLSGLMVSEVQAQTIWAGNDTSICPGQNATLTVHLTNNAGVPPQNISWCGSVTGTCDDSYSDAWASIGFTFNFYGNNYTQCLIGTNGVITFSGSPSSFCQWSIGANIPSASCPTNAIMFPWQDNYPTRPPASARYKTIGTAPNRIFVVEFLDVQAFTPGICPGSCYGNQVMLYEGSNKIETHMMHKQSCAGWNSGRAIHGIQNSTGTIAHCVPGRNGLDPGWYVNQPPFVAAPNSPGPEGRRWTPTGPSSYTISVIPFAPIYMPTTLPAPATITWNQAGGPAVGTGLSVNVSPAATTDYVVTIPMSGACTALNFRDTVRVNMGNLPLTTSPAQTICVGDTATIYANSVLAGVSYSWAPAGTLTTPLQDTTQAFPGATTTYTVSASNAGCTATATVVVNVNPLPVPGVNPVNPQICDGQSVNMTANGGTSYLWSPGTGLSSTNTASTTATPTTTTTYTITVTDVNGCSNTISNTVSFFSNPTVTANAATPGVCLTFSDQLGANGAVNYVWSPAAGLDFTVGANPTATPNATTNYQVIGTDANGCKDTAWVQVLVYPNPVSAFSAPVTSACQPLTVNLQDNSNISSGSIVGWNWTIESNGSSSAQNPSFTFPGIGDFDVTLITTSDMGCMDTLTIVDYLHSYSVPTAGFYATPNPATLGDALVTFTNTSSTDVVSSLWDIDGMATINAMNPDYNFTFADTFDITLIVTTINGCTDTVTSQVIVEDVSEIWIPNSFTPNGDGLNDTWFPIGRNLDQGNVAIEVEIFDRWGMSVFGSMDVNKQWTGKIGGSASDCPQDIYVYKVYFKNEKGKEFNYTGHINLIR